VIGNFNFTPVRKTFDAEEVELLEKATEDVSFALEVLKKKFKIKTEEAVFKVRKDTILLRRYLLWEYLDVAGLTTYVNPSWCQISGLSFQEALGNGWLNAVHDDDKAAIINGWQNATTINEKLMSEYRSCALTAKLHGSWGLFLRFRKSDCGLCGYRYRYYRA
jgi:PAS domain-containing protein